MSLEMGALWCGVSQIVRHLRLDTYIAIIVTTIGVQV